jgi:hypothetical protein
LFIVCEISLWRKKVIDPKKIPDEVEEAAWYGASDNMKASIAAALSAWPGMEFRTDHIVSEKPPYKWSRKVICLPLPEKDGAE